MNQPSIGPPRRGKMPGDYSTPSKDLAPMATEILGAIYGPGPEPTIQEIHALAEHHISQDGPTVAAVHEYCDAQIQWAQDRNDPAAQPTPPRMAIIRAIMDKGFRDPKATQASVQVQVGRYVEGAIQAAADIPAALDEIPDRAETDAYGELYMQHKEATGQFKHVDISGPREPFRMTTTQDLKDDINGRPRRPSLKVALHDADAEAAAPDRAPPPGDQTPKVADGPAQDTTAGAAPDMAPPKTANAGHRGRVRPSCPYRQCVGVLHHVNISALADKWA